MFRNIPPILAAKQLLDRSIRRTKKIQIHDRDKRYEIKKIIIARTETFITDLTSQLESYVKNFPSIDKLPLFYQEIIDIKIDTDKLKKSLGAIDWARKTTLMVYSTQSSSIIKSGNVEFLKQKQKEIYGRVSSIVKQVDKNLVFLSNAQKILRTFPDLEDIPTVVIAGYPNVGKSSLIRQLSAAKPEVAQYPFTTKQIYVGHMEKTVRYEKKQYQIIDTPGLLDRPLSERNNIEKQAIAALRNLADLIVFIFDPSETSGYQMSEQTLMLEDIKKLFCDVPFIIVENKVDVKNTGSANRKISCTTGEGIEELRQEILSVLDHI
ncbi:MAG: 50S ribosome-binding GTPase [Thermoplasmata archaeon]|nr:50S ribosome-binding GTPase [Thermoplasmata archaeon]MBE3137809.1 50S ribosome-binding GTPase [Thermoplasmata archaeon]MBE3140533.1 50S ribosome-binding GTPase [Thermoplasmata archaeon]